MTENITVTRACDMCNKQFLTSEIIRIDYEEWKVAGAFCSPCLDHINKVINEDEK